MEIFAERLRELRISKGLSQEQLGEILGVTRGSISFYENADRTPNIELLYKAAQHFDVSTDYLLGFNGSNKAEINAQISKELKLSDKAIETLREYSRMVYYNGELSLLLETPTTLEMVLEMIKSLLDGIDGKVETRWK